MLRSEIISGVENINHALGVSKLPENISGSLNASMEGPRDGTSNYFSELLNSFHVYDREAIRFDRAEKSIAEICGLSILSDIAWRSKFMSTLLKEAKENFSALHSLVMPVITSLRNFKDVVPKISALLVAHSDFGEEFYKQTIEITRDEVETLTLILPERDGYPSSSVRVSKAIEAISAFYDVIAAIKNERGHSIYIVSCDSGSNKVFDFKGSGEILKGVKEIILSIWDKAITHRKDEFVSRLDAVKNTLPIIITVSEMGRAGTISAQEAHRLNKMLVSSAAAFLETGSMIPEIKEESYFEPEKLMGLQEPLLLPAPSVVEPEVPSGKATPRTRKKSPRLPASSRKLTTKSLKDK